MALLEVKCPHCGGAKIKKYGKSKTVEQRYLCVNVDCENKKFR